ncbi:MAG: hypothetical protein DBX59_09225 [Bacillota bacterium]|nr:MAG: hypothetical protein DBX59_09225 [Bacillota bacterium]
MSKFGNFLDKKFQLTEKGTSVRTEIVAGLVTFMTMVYILLVNAGMFADLGGIQAGSPSRDQLYNGVYIATALSAVIGTVLIGLMAKLPLAQASGMGLNAFFVYTVCGFGMGNGLTYANALVFILVDGLVFVLLTVTGLRKAIFNAIPDCVKVAIPAGIGLFIAFIGLQNAGIVVLNTSTKVAMVSLNFLAGATYASVFPVLVTFAGFIAIAVLSQKNVKGAVLWGILGSAVLYYVFAAIGLAAGDATCKAIFEGITFANPIEAFKDFGNFSVAKVFTEGFDFSAFLNGTYISTTDVPATAHTVGQLILLLITTSFAFCIVDMFDTLGTLYGACARGNLLDENGNVPNLDKAMMADAIATCVGAVCGTSTVTTFVESSAGIAAGGKTGLTSIVVGLCFFVAMFLSPIAKLIPTYATAAALIYVGVLMMNGVTKIDWLKPAVAVPAFVTISMTAFTYSISFGIGLGLITYVIIQLCTGKFCKTEKTVVAEDGTEKAETVRSMNDVVTLIISLLFVAMFFLTH